MGTDKLKSCDDDLSGIVTDDKTGDITITLGAPDTKFPFALAETWTAPTPAAKSPCKGQENPPPPGYGPYTWTIQNPSRQFTLTKNPDFDLPGIPQGKVDKITVIKSSVSKMTQDVINGNLDFMTEDPTGDQLPEVRQKYSDRISLAPNPPNIYYFSMNVTIPPFNKIEARKAVNYAIDSRALQRIFSGRLDPTCNFIPKDVIGHKETTCPYGDPNGPGQHCQGQGAGREVRHRGPDRDVLDQQQGPAPGDRRLHARPAQPDRVQGQAQDPGPAGLLRSVRPEPQQAADRVHRLVHGLPAPLGPAGAVGGGGVARVEPTFNTQYVNDPTLNKQIADLVKQDPEKVADQYADLDKYIVQDKAYLAPYGTEQSTSFFSERMDSKDCNGVHPLYKNDWLQFCLKG